MAKEIERKFLVISEQYREGSVSSLYRQGYILNSREKCVRVRVCNDKGYLTIKGATQRVTRSEFEYEIPQEEANTMLDLFCGGAILEKDRHILTYGGFRWEVDEFHGDNEGLVVAEIELPEEETEFPKPAWLGLEVSDDPRYFNSNLLKLPFKDWADADFRNG